MKPEDRRQAIMDVLMEAGTASIEDLALRFDVSKMTAAQGPWWRLDPIEPAIRKRFSLPGEDRNEREATDRRACGDVDRARPEHHH
jgi:hypothetical protein